MGIAVNTGQLLWNFGDKWKVGLRRYRCGWCLFFGFGSVARWSGVSGWSVSRL